MLSGIYEHPCLYRPDIKVVWRYFRPHCPAGFFSLIFPLQMADPQWQLTTITGIVDRGIVPMLGMGLISLGYLVDTMAKTAGASLKVALICGCRFIFWRSPWGWSFYC
ncbi:hypothetical protein NON20_13080 [Synechocystis sp. B12]|nr:hypothetical protein NON20_13080 [Synechocystis sp. B12]